MLPAAQPLSPPRTAARLRGREPHRLRGALAPTAVAVMALPQSFIATAYGPPWDAMQGTGTTATGIKLAPAPQSSMRGPYVVAVDPAVIPLGTKLKISPNPFGDPNIVFEAADTGGAIKGPRIDFYDPLGRPSQLAWGRRPVRVSILGKGSAIASPIPWTDPSSGSSAAASTSPSSGPSEWVELLLDAVLIGFGAAAIYRGTRRMTSAKRAA